MSLVRDFMAFCELNWDKILILHGEVWEDSGSVTSLSEGQHVKRGASLLVTIKHINICNYYLASHSALKNYHCM